MSFLTEWLTNIILLILLASILEMMLPSSVMKRYVKMVVGILLLFLILKPLLSIFSVDVENQFARLSAETAYSDHEITNLINLQKTEIESGQRAYISEQIAVQLEEDAKEVVQRQYALTVTSLQVELDSDEVTDVSELEIKTVYLQIRDEVKEEEEEDERIIRVEEVQIDTSQSLSTELPSERHQDIEQIRLLLSERWQLPKETILITWEGGKRAR